MTKLWGDEAGRATKTDCILVLGATEAGRRRAMAAASNPVDWTWPLKGLRTVRSRQMLRLQRVRSNESRMAQAR